MESSSSSMEVTPPWVELPRELTAMILHKLGPIDILRTAEKVCTTWRSVCWDATMWRSIDLRHEGYPKPLLEVICRQAVDRSQGQLIDISIQRFGFDDLLRYISERSIKLKCLRLAFCNEITNKGLSEAVKILPFLGELHIYDTYIRHETIKAVGRNCPLLKSFKFNKRYMGYYPEDLIHIMQDGSTGPPELLFNRQALAVAENMRALRHLHLIGNVMSKKGVLAILDGCPHLESLDLRQCFGIVWEEDLEQLCRQRIKDFRNPMDPTDDYEFVTEHIFSEKDLYGDDIDDGYSDSGGSVSSTEEEDKLFVNS